MRCRSCAIAPNLRDPETGPRDTPMVEQHEQHLPRLLAIDDSELIQRLLRVRLRQEHIEIHAAATGAEGLRLAEALTPDVILLDLDLPDMDGHTVLEQLGNSASLRDVPVIFISADRETDVKVKCFDMGAHDFIVKPFDVAELRARVRAAIRLHRMVTLLAQRAQVDGLTGLWNRAYMDQRLRETCSYAARNDGELALVIADLDHFKSVNDTHGHPFGDRVMQTFAQILDEARESDIACRYGGEEFALIIPGASAEDARVVSERVRARLEQVNWGEGYEDVRITASFGVVSRRQIDPATGRIAQKMIDAADAALYAAKQAGRNRVVVAGEEDVQLRSRRTA